MPLNIVGIDEAGYGPMLGPLVVARSSYRVKHWQASQPAPDLWKLLAPAVCRKGNDRKARLPFDDSKKLKKANDCDEPLEHLLRTVLAVLACRGQRPATDLELFECLGTVVEPQPWYDGPAHRLPGLCESAAARVGIDSNCLCEAMERAGVELLDLSVIAIGEQTFNHIVRREGSKAATTAMAVGQHVRHAWETWGADPVEGGGGPRIVCDRQGGRADYTGPIKAWLRGVSIETIEQNESRSRYRVTCRVSGRQATLLFATDSESFYLPIALASMAAKLTRELLMARFNRYWAARAGTRSIELKPTAGYVQDARRWLTDAQAVLSPQERQTLVRMA